MRNRYGGPTMTCPRCHYLLVGGTVCPMCGYVAPIRSEPRPEHRSALNTGHPEPERKMETQR